MGTRSTVRNTGGFKNPMGNAVAAKAVAQRAQANKQIGAHPISGTKVKRGR
jgi:hypothetical protein